MMSERQALTACLLSVIRQPSETAMPQSTSSIKRCTILLFLLVFPSLAIAQKPKPKKPAQSKPAQSAPALNNPGPSVEPPKPPVTGTARIAWAGTPKIARYRLQLARDEAFSDLVFDKVVVGREYTVTELAPGGYFWRVA